MLLLLAGAFFISFICFAWGSATVKWIRSLTGEKDTKHLPVSIICLCGLSVLLAFAAIFSLFMPMGSWYVRALLFAPALFLFINTKRNKGVKLDLKTLEPITFFLFSFLLILLLLMGSWAITHPDTLGYHFQTIEWIRDYKIIPGLAHINLRYGLQGLWFPLCALFDFTILKVNIINLLNFTVVLWFVFFLVEQIDQSFKKPGPQGILWLGLLLISLWNYPQIRLTITSASPDFIVSVVIWTVIYLLLRSDDRTSLTLVVIFCFISICIKLSSLPLFLIAVYAFYRLLKQRAAKTALFVIAFGFAVFSAFAIRNSITTGYILYPSTWPDWIHADWKINRDVARQQADYITSYARTHASFEEKEIINTKRMTMDEWVPVWWKNLSASDKLVLIVLLASVLATIIFLRKIIVAADIRLKVALLTLFSGILFWFYYAPDPRFASGFIIGFIALAGKTFLPFFRFPVKQLMSSSVIFILGLVFLYSVYRLIYFFSPQQILLPLEIEKKTSKTIECNGVRFKAPLTDTALLPGVNECEKFALRGKRITDGFKNASRRQSLQRFFYSLIKKRLFNFGTTSNYFIS